jgi:hypothetical protein
VEHLPEKLPDVPGAGFPQRLTDVMDAALDACSRRRHGANCAGSSSPRKARSAAGVVSRDEAAALEQRMFAVEESGRKSPETALLSEEA